MKKTILNFSKYESEIIDDPKTKNDYLRLNSYERKKYKKYLKILSKRLNNIHNENYEFIFWNKILFYFLLVHISQCYRIFRSIKKIQKYKTIECTKFRKYHIPETITDHRNLFHKSFVGQEILFSELIEPLKGYDKINKIYKNNLNFNKESHNSKKLNYDKKNQTNFLVIRLINFILKNVRKPTILASRCYWSERFKHLLKFKLHGQLSIDEFFIPKMQNTSKNLENRSIISKMNKDFDEFDNFFFRTLKFSIPKSFIETFKSRKKYTLNFLNQKKYLNLKYLLNENLDEDNLLLNALASQKKIKSIYIEHNFLHYPFIGSHLDLILDNFDKYITSGWGEGKSKKIIKGATLSGIFDFNNFKRSERPKSLIFVGSLPAFRYPFTSSMFGEEGLRNSKILLKNLDIFFNNLNDYNQKNLLFKRHPFTQKRTLSAYSEEDKFFFNRKNIKKNILSNDLEFEAYLPDAKLVIMQHYSTPFFSSILYNVPTVVCLHKNAYFLKDNYKKYFDDFYKVGIFQHNSKAASLFVNKISKNPNLWWNSKSVQNVRNKYLKENMNNNFKDFENFLIRLT